MALADQKTDDLTARLHVLGAVWSGGWSAAARRDAVARLQGMALPHRRDEYWKFTNPGPLTQPVAQPAEVFDPDETPIFSGIDRLKLVFVDGVFDAAQSDDLEMAGVEVDRLAATNDRDIHWGRELYGKLEARGQQPVARSLAALNTAYATDGALIRVTGRAPKPISLIYLRKNPTSDAILHHLIKVEPGAEITLLENGPAAARFNSVLEVEVADGGKFHHIRAQGRDHERRAITHMFARLGADALVKSFTITANGTLTRNEVVVDIVGDQAVAHIAGAAMGDRDFHHDDTIFITHEAVACESRQVFKKVLRNGATGVFQGKILVKPTAQKTDGYQISQALLLDEDSQFLAKPELEIYADDVACSHGSTSGAIDENALFYLRSRGLARHEAQDLLVLAFLAEAIDEIADSVIADDILSRLRGWLQRHRA